MKIKFSKTLAIACILCMTFATLTAFATETAVDWNDVSVVTSYDVSNAATTPIEVIATVGGVEEGDEVTYYVSKVEEGVEKIVYIDQATAKGTSVEFTFNATQGDVLASTAKNGSDAGDDNFPTFTFAAGVNYQTEGSAHVVEVEDNWGVSVEDYEADTENATIETTDSYADSALIYQGQISGKVSRYGVKVVDAQGALICDFDAMGCDEHGNFVVIIDGYDVPNGATVVAFAE